MPKGEGTYGSQVGRPPKNERKPYNKGTQAMNPTVRKAYNKTIETKAKYFNKYPEAVDKFFEKDINTIAKNIGFSTERVQEDIEDRMRELVLAKREEQEIANPLGARTGRMTKAEGGSLLNNDRQQYAEGSKAVNIPKQKEYGGMYDDVMEGEWLILMRKVLEGKIKDKKEIKRIERGFKGEFDNETILLLQQHIESDRTKKAEGGELDNQMEDLMPTHTMPDGTVMPGATHGEYEEQMEGLMDKETPMLPDEEMEEDYVDYVVSSTLEEEDKNYLESALAEDAKLSELFDQVVESASEFSGSGPIEGPGTEVSDSIPARLSDGEFGFTAKATDEIGEDNLMSMMNDAEAAADERQTVAYGGVIDEEDQAVPIQTRGSVAAQGNVPNVVKQSRQVEEEMLKSSPRRYYVPVSG